MLDESLVSNNVTLNIYSPSNSIIGTAFVITDKDARTVISEGRYGFPKVFATRTINARINSGGGVDNWENF